MSTNATKNTGPEKLAERATVAPPVDIFEDKNEIVIFADLPGVAPDGLSVHLDRSELTIEGRRGASADGEGGNAFDYKRVFVVPRGIDSDKIGALLQNGLLKLTLPKPEAAKPRQIAVRSG